MSTLKCEIARLDMDTVIYFGTDTECMRKTVEWCIDYLAQRGFRAAASKEWNQCESNAPLWVFELEGDCPATESMGVDIRNLENARGDAYILNIFTLIGRSVVSIVGKDIRGVRSGLARLIASASLFSDRMEASVRNEVNSPFFRIRRIHVGQTGRVAKKDPWTDSLWTNWSDGRIEKYVEQLWLFGFNSIEVGELRGYANQFPLNEKELAEKVTPKIKVLATAAREYGLEVCQFIWGQSLFEEGQNLCWNNPAERAMMRAEYSRLAQTYGDLVDHIVIHVGDPGGCDRNGCDAYRVPQEIANAVLAEYRKVNPACTATLSSWANFGFWKDDSGTQFLSEGFSNKDMAIALHRWYDRDKARLLKSAGREVDIWGWYLGDYEMELNCHLLMKRLDKYFSMIPDEASESVRAISTETCFLGLPSLINAYVAAQKMWKPGRALDEIEREFCAATFGVGNADAVLSIYNACEEYVHPGNFMYFVPETDCTGVVFGTPGYNKRITRALEKAGDVVIVGNSPAGFTNSTPALALYGYLCNQLKLIHIFSKARETMDILSSQEAAPAESAGVGRKAVAEAAPYKDTLDYQHFLDEMKAEQRMR